MNGLQLRANAHHFSTGAIVISFSAAISAFDQGRQWEQALTLLHKMSDTGMTANMISTRSVLTAWEHGGRWKQEVALLTKMRYSGMTAKMISWRWAIT